MSQNPLDQTQDTSQQEKHRLITLFSPPEFVKSATHERLIAAADLPRHMYAEPFKKLYPCHTAPATWLSALFFSDKRSNFNEKTAASIQEKIHDAAAYFGILNTVKDLEQKVAAATTITLDSLPDSQFALVWEDQNGHKDRHWPLRNKNEVKYAADYFSRYGDDFRFADRNKIASKILDRADAVQADISEHVHELSMAAGNGTCATKAAATMLSERAKLAQRSHAEAAQHMKKLAEAVSNSSVFMRDKDARVKLASLVDDYDRETHLNRLYGEGGLLRAEEVLFAITEKTARDFTDANVETTTGNVYSLNDLEKIAIEQIRNWMGDEFADAVSVGGVMVDRDKVAAIVPTLDRGMASMLDRMLHENKVAAVVTTKASDSLLPDEELYRLAAEAE